MVCRLPGLPEVRGVGQVGEGGEKLIVVFKRCPIAFLESDGGVEQFDLKPQFDIRDVLSGLAQLFDV